MKFSFVHEKTTVWQVDNQVVQVSNLPEELRNEIATLDKLYQDKIEAIYRLETVELAAVVKAQQIHALVAQLVKKSQENQATAANNDAEVQQELNKLANEKPKKATKK